MTTAEIQETYVETQDVAAPLVAQQGAISFYLSALLFSAALICFAGGLMADLAYVNDPDIAWSNFSTWLLAFGEFFVALVILFGILGFLFRFGARRTGTSWLYALLVIAAAVAGLFDNFIHTHDGWTSVWSTGLALSVLTVGLLVFALLIKLARLSNTYLVEAE